MLPRIFPTGVLQPSGVQEVQEGSQRGPRGVPEGSQEGSQEVPEGSQRGPGTEGWPRVTWDE